MKTSLVSLCSHNLPHEVNFYQEDLDSFLAIAEEFHLEEGEAESEVKTETNSSQIATPGNTKKGNLKVCISKNSNTLATQNFTEFGLHEIIKTWTEGSNP